MKDKVTTTRLREMKRQGEKITMLTAYDYLTAKLLDELGIEVILVGDSLGMVVLGYETTLPVTMADMLHHTAAVARGCQRCLVVGDMPFLSYQVSIEKAVENAGAFLQKAGAQAVKVEGGREIIATIKKIVEAGIPVMGHLGVTPQSIHKLGGYGLRAKELAEAKKLIEDALALEEAGVFAIVLEKIPTPVAKMVTENISIPTIGIGAGPFCDGQVLVTQDLLGIFEKFVPKFVKRYANLAPLMREAISDFIKEVKTGQFPTDKQSYEISETEIAKIVPKKRGET
jgi:3-methyl-2-oxobutanoate hydroxymethyltransferase